MTSTAYAATTMREPATQLTLRQQQVFRAVLTEREQTHRDRAAQAAAVLDGPSSRDSPWDREIAREALASWLEGLVQHQAALERLELGEYGACRTCARPIPFERLEAIPEVERCVGCSTIG